MTAPTLALEALMLDPRYGQLVDKLRATAPVGLLDQADQAATDAHNILATIAVHLSDDHSWPVTAADLPGWLRLGLVDALVGFVAGKAATCLHGPHPLRPQPVMAAAWKPGVVACRRCPHLLALPRESVADRTCDACGHVCAGAGDPIYPGMVQFGPLIYQYGTCARCGPLQMPERHHTPR